MFTFWCSCAVGIGLPVYSTFKAIEKKDLIAQEKWLVYWAGSCCIYTFLLSFLFISVFYLEWFSYLQCMDLLLLLRFSLTKFSLGTFFISTSHMFKTWIISLKFAFISRKFAFLFCRFPLYYHAKLAFLIWLQLPPNYVCYKTCKLIKLFCIYGLKIIRLFLHIDREQNNCMQSTWRNFCWSTKLGSINCSAWPPMKLYTLFLIYFFNLSFLCDFVFSAMKNQTKGYKKIC